VSTISLPYSNADAGSAHANSNSSGNAAARPSQLNYSVVPAQTAGSPFSHSAIGTRVTAASAWPSLLNHPASTMAAQQQGATAGHSGSGARTGNAQASQLDYLVLSNER